MSFSDKVMLANQIAKIIDKIMPCNCHVAYISRGLQAPDCPNCNFKKDLAHTIASRLRVDKESVKRIIIDKEYIPTVYEDSGQAEWSNGEAEKLAKALAQSDIITMSGG